MPFDANRHTPSDAMTHDYRDMIFVDYEGTERVFRPVGANDPTGYVLYWNSSLDIEISEIGWGTRYLAKVHGEPLTSVRKYPRPPRPTYFRKKERAMDAAVRLALENLL